MIPTSQQFDVIVVGMGPAGSSVAFELSRAGVSVLGLEKQTHPRYKVCGGGLSARIEQYLPTDFKSVVEEEVHRLHFTYGPEESYVIDSEKPFVYMVMRSRFDQWLVHHAQVAGTEVHQNETVTRLKALPEGVEVETDKGRYFSRVVVGADGALSVVAQQLFPGRRLQKVPALESEILFGEMNLGAGQPDTQLRRYANVAIISLNAAKKGYGWIFPKHHGLSIGVGEFVRGDSRPMRSFQQCSQEDPNLSGYVVPPPVGHPLPICNGYADKKGQRWNGGLVHTHALLVSDAGHLVDPLLGEGILYAVRSGQLAATTIVDYLHNTNRHLEAYEEAIIQELGPEFRIASRLNKVVYGIPRSWHRWVGRTFPVSYQGLLRRYCGMLQSHETYRTLWARMMLKLQGPFATASKRADLS